MNSSVGRLVASLPAIVQIVIAVVISYSISHYVLGHSAPVTAVTVTISSLGFVRDARPVRVIETAAGVTLGIALSESIVLGFGQGVWQLAAALAITLTAARLLSPAAPFAIVAGVQSVLVAVLPVQPGGPFTRTIDGVIGGAIALACTALIPRDPRRAALRDGKRFLSAYVDLVSSLVAVLRVGHETETDRVLEQARRTQPLIDAWRGSLDSAVAIARISPFLRKHLGDLERQQVIQHNMDLAMRNLRVVTRRLAVLDRDGMPRPEFAEILSGVVSGVNLLSQSLTEPELAPLVRQNLILIAVQLHPKILLPGQPLSETSVVFAVRPLVMDLLVAAGLSPDEARAAMPDITA
ncbi:aromatic acid exporter family protein [Agreia sp. COWG]|uniref:FUSC family protein n=1 Tax=Agreia sp. COWG TaxID=2773266 RepID=UPI001926E4AC|nr:FUSC family protein [Agreia sp. COWG]